MLDAAKAVLRLINYQTLIDNTKVLVYRLNHNLTDVKPNPKLCKENVMASYYIWLGS